MGKVKRESYTDIPKENLYNMDEMAIKTSKHRKTNHWIQNFLGLGIPINFQE